MTKRKKRQIRALKGPIKWKLPDGTIVEDTWRDFARRPIEFPYTPLYQTPLPKDKSPPPA